MSATIIILTVAAAHTTSDAQTTWTHFASTPARTSATPNTAPPLTDPAWTAALDTNDDPITFAGPTGVVADADRAYAIGTSAGQAHLYAFDRTAGDPAWQAPIDAPQLDSWSTPAIDQPGAAVLVASGNALHALDAGTGEPLWTADLPGPVVNASPLATADLHPADRAFITTFDGFGDAARLVCVNIDPFDAALNPHQPGDVLWTVPIGASSGNTPAYHAGVVYAATADEPGRVLAVDATATAEPDPLWATENPAGHPFFAGVAVAGGAVYAASYSFSGAQLNSNLVKLDAATGEPHWSTPAGRTASTPIPLPDGTILLSTGLHGFGAVPSVQRFADLGDHADLLWDSALATWNDADDDGAIDTGEYLSIGGWTHQPIVADAAGEPVLVVGSMDPDAGPLAPYAELRLIDLGADPADDAFVIEQLPGPGSTPALAGATLLSIGPGGLHAIEPACLADCDENGLLNVLDFVCFQQLFQSADPSADCDDNGVLNVLDFVCFQSAFATGCDP